MINLCLRKKVVVVSFFAALFSGFIAHGFAILNVLQYYDSIVAQPGGIGTGLPSGRWALEYIGLISKSLFLHYQLPFINGIIFLIIIALAAALISIIFQVSNIKIATLIGMLFTTFPSVTSTMLFPYTSVPYAISILLSVVAVLLTHKHKKYAVTSSLCIAISMGIYQAYVPITISLFVILLIRQALNGNTSFKTIFKTGLFYCSIIAFGTILYFIFLKLNLVLFDTSLNDYKGMDKMGQISMQELPGLVIRTLVTFCSFPYSNYCIAGPTPLMTVSYYVLGALTFIIILCCLVFRVRKISLWLMVALLCMVFPFAINFIVFICPRGSIQTLMVYSFALIPCLPLLLYDQMRTWFQTQCPQFQRWIHYSLFLVCSLLVFLNTYHANTIYTTLYYANRQMENYTASIVTQVRMTEGFDTSKKWAFMGYLDDPFLENNWDNYYGVYNPTSFMDSYSYLGWFRQYLGYYFPVASHDEINTLGQTELFAQMPEWPDHGSVQISGNYVIIKFNDDYLYEE